jgi:thymidylate kinase
MIITFSGIDGSGKTYLSEKLTQLLCKMDIEAFYKKPAYTCNDIVKNFCKNRFGDEYQYFPKLDPTFYINVLLTDWIDFLQSDLMNHQGKILICDRYIVDVLAQGIHYGAQLKAVENLLHYFPTPDYSFYLEIEPECAYNRLTKRAFPPRHHLESLSNLNLLELAYKKIKKEVQWDFISISANDEPEILIDKIKASLKTIKI